MRPLLTILIGVLVLASCGDGNDRPAPSSGASGGATAPATGLVSESVIASCAGFTAAKAAEILGVDVGGVTDSSRDQGRLRFCSYQSATTPSKAVSFTLGRRDSVAAAAESLKGERRALGGAQGAIDRVTKSPSDKPASEDVTGIGDEAFYSSMNGAIMLRVGNVLAQVMAPSDMALKRRVAEEVARGLRP